MPFGDLESEAKMSRNVNSKTLSKGKKLLVILISVIVAAALGVTCALCFGASDKVFGGGGQSGTVTQSTTFTNDNAVQDKVLSGTMKKGDIINYTTVGVRDVIVPAGTYTLEVWGAQGGGSGATWNVGYGGYTKGTVTFTAATTLTIVVGGKGANGVVNQRNNDAAGGYNGGGAGGRDVYDMNQPAGGGGGATHIATAKRGNGLLTNYGSYRGDLLMVAGGGGGTSSANPNNGRYGGGGGANNSGYNGWSTTQGNGNLPSNKAGAGGSTAANKGGAAGTCTTIRFSNGYQGLSHNGSAGGFGQGGAGGVNHAGGGGGGGGYFGGGGGGVYNWNGGTGAGDGAGYCNSAGGGSGYANTSKLTGIAGDNGVRAGDGYARITIVEVNKAPRLKNNNTAIQTVPNTTGEVRGGGKSIVVTAGSLAEDPEGGKLYFTNGTSTDLDALTAAGFDIYTNAACTSAYSAKKYIDYTLDTGGKESFTITAIKMYPRAGVDGAPANGTLNLYVKIRDNFGKAGSAGKLARAVSVINFRLKVKDDVITAKEGVGVSGDTVLVGTSANGATPDNASKTNIYHPSGADRYTALIKTPLKLNGAGSSVKINAADLFNGLDTAYGSTALIALTDTSKINKNVPSRTIKVNELDDSTPVTAYTAAGAQIPNAFKSITVTGVHSCATYQSVTVTLYVVENSSSRGANYQLPFVSAIPIDIVFKVDNTRPTLSQSVLPYVELTTLQTKTVSLNQFYIDNDNAQIKADTHKIIDVKVPTGEFMLFDKYGNIVSTKITEGVYNNHSYFNLIGSSAPSASRLDTAWSSTAQIADVPTGFESWYASSGASDTAFVQYSFKNDELTLTGLRATYDMYDAHRSTLRFAESGNKSGSVVCDGDVERSSAGHFYILLKIQDVNEPDDVGIWLPLCIKVNNTAPDDIGHERGGQGATEMPTAEGGAKQTFYFTPMGITVNGKTEALGAREVDGALSYDVSPLASDADNFFNPSMTNGSGVINELLTLRTAGAAVQASVSGNAAGEYFTVEDEKIYIPKSVFGGRLDANDYISADYPVKQFDGEDYVAIRGLKVTLKNYTHNRYLYAKATVTDGIDEKDIYIAVFVNNKTPIGFDEAAFAAGKVSTVNYVDNGRSVKSEYTPVSASNSIPTITYDIPMHSKVIVTPYDLLTDDNMTASGVGYPQLSIGGKMQDVGFTLNGFSGKFANGIFTVGSGKNNDINGIATSANGIDYSSVDYASALEKTLLSIAGKRSFTGCIAGNNLFATPGSASNVGIDRLYFERNNDMEDQYLDGFSFDAYDTAAHASAFATPVVRNSMYVDYNFGHTLELNGKTHRLDFIVIEAKQRTVVEPAEFIINVRDRTGAGASGDATGIAQIRIVINVINSTPYVNNPSAVYTLSTSPVAANGTVAKSVMMFSATSDNGGDALLADNEGDPVSFDISQSISVYDGEGRTQLDGKDYLGNYIDVSITAQTLTVTALNSTQHINKLYIGFYATDGRVVSAGRVSQLYIQVQVLNSVPTLNYGENGFEMGYYDKDDLTQYYPIWSIDTVTDADITTPRYFASGNAAKEYLSEPKNIGADKTVGGISDAQVKVMYADSDKLQGAVLSPLDSTPNPPQAEQRKYINVSGGNYKDAVPYISTAMAAGSPVAAVVHWKKLENGVPGIGNNAISSTAPNGSPTSDFVSYDILYFVDTDGDGVKETYSANDLRAGGVAAFNNNPGKFFDDEGRWAVTDWAIVITPKSAFSAGAYMFIEVMTRDEAKYGGDSAGIASGYDFDPTNSATDKKAVVYGYDYIGYHFFVKDTGIITYDYYDRFDGYYTVADGADSTKNYISTYDGATSSIYTSSNTSSIYYNSATGYVGNDSTQGSRIKECVINRPDNTLAGTNSGTEYGSADASFDGAFRYSHEIEVSGNKNEITYIPMSYFALRSNLVGKIADDGSVTYHDKKYVAYDVPGADEVPYARGTISQIQSAITVTELSTGREWTGSTLQQNPYVTFTAYDSQGDTTNKAYAAAMSGKYANKALAVTTVNSSGANEYITSANTQNMNNLVGNGHIMYLAEQQSKIQENQFGIGISKKDTRSSVSDVTVTIAVANCELQEGAKAGTVTNYSDADAEGGAEDKDKYSARLTFNLNIGNSEVDIDTTGTEVSGDETTGYYTSLMLTSGGNAHSVRLDRTVPADKAADTTYVKYADADSKDEAYFYSESLLGFSYWTGGLANGKHSRLTALTNGSDTSVGTAPVFANTAASAKAQASMRNYFAGLDVQSVNGIATNGFTPNGGIYGASNGSEGYSKYFSVSITDGGRNIVIAPNAKTFINTSAIGYPEKGNLSMSNHIAAIKDYYAKRGLVADCVEKDGRATVVAAYYPLRVVIYDNCGDGFDSGSYISLEIRVQISGSAPALSQSLANTIDGVDNGDKTMNIALAVNSNYNINLYEIIRGKDLLSDNGKLYWASDYAALKRQTESDGNIDNMFRLETGSYLVSPFENGINAGTFDTDNRALINGTAGFAHNAENGTPLERQPDVIMYMEVASAVDKLTADTAPIDNMIRYHVNRRTTYNNSLNNPVQKMDFDFTLVFRDNAGNATGTLTVKLNVLNSPPEIRAQALETDVNNITMRVGDSFTLVTTPWNKFADGSASSQASNSYKTITNPNLAAYIGSPNLGPYNNKPANAVKYQDLTETNLADPAYKLRSYRVGVDDVDGESKHLGYLAVATDDTPWALRIDSVTHKSGYFRTEYRDRVSSEGAIPSGGQNALDVVIFADNACTNMPISVTISDDCNERVTYTMYVTVVSSKPNPITQADVAAGRPLNEGLEIIPGRVGEYRLYMNVSQLPSGVMPDDPIKKVSVNNEGVKDAYSDITIDISKIAYDRDKNDNAQIGLFTSMLLPTFTVNGLAMNFDQGTNRYYNDKYEIIITDNGRQNIFTIKCLSFDMTNDWDELKFYVRDVGNNVYENAVPITIRICTLYSAIGNTDTYIKEITTATGMLTGTSVENRVDKVYVKSKDMFDGIGLNDGDERIGQPSKYTLVAYGGMSPDVDQNNGGANSFDRSGIRITDPDVKIKHGGDDVVYPYNLNYDVKIYALMDWDRTSSTYVSKLLNNSTSSLFDINRNTGKFIRKASSDFDSYLIGGRRADGTSYDSDINESLLAFINRYFLFSIGADGVSVEFIPVTATLNTDILFYAEVEKQTLVPDENGDTRVCVPTSDTAVKAGTIFYVRVKDSAPIANKNTDVLSFSGKIGDVGTFTIFDRNNSDISMFSDSDTDDVVIVNGFVPGSRDEAADYAAALEGVKYDWKVSSTKPRAIDISVNNDDGTLTVKINRRIDERNEKGEYLPYVTLPVVITGVDRAGETTKVTLYITIENSDFTVKPDAIKSSIDSRGIGYSLESSDSGKDYEYVIDTYVSKDIDPVTLNVIEWFDDPDFTTVTRDTDSYRLVANNGVNEDKYLTKDSAPLNVYAEDDTTVIGTLTPVFANGDEYHFTGFTVAAASWMRGFMGTAYVRVIDRSGDAADLENGITFIVHVWIANSAPTVKDGVEKQSVFNIVGSNTEQLDSIQIDIKDYVTDPNSTDTVEILNDKNTYLRIVSAMTIEPTRVFSSKYIVDSHTDIVDVITVATDEGQNRYCKITPKTGYFGSQSVSILVADGDLVNTETRTVAFTVTFNVAYDFADVGELNGVSLVRGLTTDVTATSLMKDVTVDSGVETPEAREVARADVTATFNPGQDFAVSELSVPAKYSDYVRIIKPDENDPAWRVRALRVTSDSDPVQLAVKFKLAGEADNENAEEFASTFNVVIVSNPKPELQEMFKNGKTFYSSGNDDFLLEDGTIHLSPEDMFTDNIGDIVSFVSASSKTPSLVEVSVDAADNLRIKFNARGSAEITVVAADLTGESKSYTFTVTNVDLDEPTFWMSIMISFEENPWIWIGILAGILLIILLIIIIVLVMKRKKRKREELEAMLVSEMELEEQMMRLAGGMGVPYQSYGYLPPTMPVQQDPGLMLGGGAGAPTNNNAIGLNPGQAPDGGNNGAPPNPGM